MNIEETNIKDDYNHQIVAEVKNICARPLGYNGSKLVKILDEFELDYRVALKDYNQTYATLHLLAHIINLDFINAKVLYKRLDADIKKSERIKAISEILKAVLNKRNDEILAAVQKAESAFQENDEARHLLQASIPILRAYVLGFLTQTFETIKREDLAKYLNLSSNEAFDYLVKNGWKSIDDGYMKAPEKIEISDKDFREITEAQFKNLSQTISFLETI